MSNPKIAYRATDPQRIREWSESLEPLYRAFEEEKDRLKKQIGKDVLIMRESFDGVWVTGYDEREGKDPLPNWRKDASSGYMMPDRRTSTGKKIAERLDRISYKPGPIPGLPELVWGEGYMGPFAVAEFDGDFYAWLGFDIREEGSHNPLDDVDPKIWERIKLSEFHAAKEAQEAKVSDVGQSGEEQ